MGTYNYCSEIISTQLHQIFDVNTYNIWGNTKDANIEGYTERANVPKENQQVKDYKKALGIKDSYYFKVG